MLGIGLSALAVVGALLVADMRWSSLLPGGGSFFSVWSGARGLLLRGEDPYGHNVALAAQELAHDASTLPGANPYWFELPLFLLPVFIPLAAIPDPTMARAVWALLGQLAYAGAILLTARLIDLARAAGFLDRLCRVICLQSLSLDGASGWHSRPRCSCSYTAPFSGPCGQGTMSWLGALCVLGLQKWEVGLPFVILLAWRIFHEKAVADTGWFWHDNLDLDRNLASRGSRMAPLRS